MLRRYIETVKENTGGLLTKCNAPERARSCNDAKKVTNASHHGTVSTVDFNAEYRIKRRRTNVRDFPAFTYLRTSVKFAFHFLFIVVFECFELRML